MNKVHLERFDLDVFPGIWLYKWTEVYADDDDVLQAKGFSSRKKNFSVEAQRQTLSETTRRQKWSDSETKTKAQCCCWTFKLCFLRAGSIYERKS